MAEKIKTSFEVNENVRNSYPYVGRYNDGAFDFLLLFHKEKCGTIIAVNKSNGGRNVGDYAETWTEEVFDPFHGTITIEV